MIRIEFLFSHFKSILLGASGEGFRKQTKEGKSLFTLQGVVSGDANKTSSELPLNITNCKYIFSNGLTAADAVAKSGAGAGCAADAAAATMDSNDYIIVSLEFFSRYSFHNCTIKQKSMRLFFEKFM